ncbi:transposase [Streptomyces rimosus]
MLDAGYDAPRIDHLLADLPVEILGRLRSDRVMRRPAPFRKAFALANPLGGLDRTRRPSAPHRGGTVTRLAVEKLPSGGNKPVRLWWPDTRATAADVDRCWQSFLRRFDLEHTFRLLKQTLGWAKPRLRSSDAADRWTWLVIAAYAQLRLAGHWPPTSAGPGRDRPRIAQAYLRSRPTGVQKPAHEDRVSNQRTVTLNARARKATWFEEPPSGRPPITQSARNHGEPPPIVK